MTDAEVLAHAMRIAALERKITQLYGHLGLEEPTGGPGDGDVDPRVLDAIQAGNLMEAIKHQREATGAGLAEAKATVDAIVAKRQGLGL
jgi:ribosomal protein L7/L12